MAKQQNLENPSQVKNKFLRITQKTLFLMDVALENHLTLKYSLKMHRNIRIFLQILIISLAVRGEDCTQTPLYIYSK